MAEKTHLSEAAIQKYEEWAADRIASHVFQNDIAQGAKQFLLLLRSYRIAANVAVAAWKLVEEHRKTGQVQPRTVEELVARLHLFAPEAPHFAPPKPLAEYTCRVFEELYDYLAQWDGPMYSGGVLLELLFARIQQLRQELHTRS